VTDVIIAVDKMQKTNGTFDDFKRFIGNYIFSPFKYAQLITLYKTHQLSEPNVIRVLAA
jgi:hypothetical protein